MIEEQGNARAPSPFRALFGFAYRRIWASWALRGWEVFLWCVVAVYLGFALHDYSPIITAYILYGVSWLGLLMLTPIFLATWVYRAHVSCGMGDDLLRIAPHPTSHLLTARLAAVILSWFQLFVPMLFVVLYNGINIFGSQTIEQPGGTCLFWAAIQILGWMLLCATWGFAGGTLVTRYGGSFMLAFFGPGVVIILGVTAFYLLMYFAMVSFLFMFEAPKCAIWPLWVQLTGIVGLIISCPIFLLACYGWGQRK